MSIFQRIISIIGGILIVVIAGDIPLWDYLNIPSYRAHILTQALTILVGILLVYFGLKGKR
mgnify:CR=1 FL=1|jgi:hypothetical protein